MEWWQILMLMTMGGIFLVDTVHAICSAVVEKEKYRQVGCALMARAAEKETEQREGTQQ